MNICPYCFGFGKVSTLDVRFCYNCRGTGLFNDMVISIIVATDLNNVIGKDDKIPWHIPGDMKYFKDLTMNKIVIMGRKTYESIKSPLPDRKKIIVTRDESYMPREDDDGVICVANSLEEAIACCYSEHYESGSSDEQEVFIIGGEEIYKEALKRDFVDRIYLTKIHWRFDGGAHFPEIDNYAWDEKSSFYGGFENNIGYNHSIYEKKIWR